MRHLRRSLPKAQDRAVLPDSGGGVPSAWAAALHAVSSRTQPIRTGGGSGVQRGRRAVVGRWSRANRQWQATLFGAAQDAAEGTDLASRSSTRGKTAGIRVPVPHPRTADGDGRSADRGQCGVGRAAARADCDAVGSGDHDRDLGGAPLGAQVEEPRSSDRGGAGGAGMQRHAGGPHGCGWRSQRPVGATAPAAGGALGAGRQELEGGPERRFRSAGTGRCRQPLGDGDRQPRKRLFEPSRMALR